MDKNAVSHIVWHDLGLKSRVCSKVQGLTARQHEKRLEQCKKFLNKLKRCQDHVLVFSDKKIFTIDAVSNSRSMRYVAKRPEDVEPAVRYAGSSKHPASAMMLGIVGPVIKCFHHFGQSAPSHTSPRSTLRTSWGPRDFGPSIFGLQTAQT